LKKLIKFRKEFILQQLSVPDLNLNEDLVRLIITSPLAEETRVEIMKSLLEKDYTLTRTNHLISIVNNTLYQINSN
jgi:hypothetical protein